MVLLPWDDERGQRGKAPTPLTDKDVEAMLNDWEKLGYNIIGFNLGQPIGDNLEGAHGQSRNIWPHADDVLRERDQRAFRVNIPDRRGKPIFLLRVSYIPRAFPETPFVQAIETRAYIDDVTRHCRNLYTSS